jgi:flagellar motor protein MotB
MELKDELTILTQIKADLDKLSSSLGLVHTDRVVSNALDFQRKLIEAFQKNPTQSTSPQTQRLLEEIIENKRLIEQMKEVIRNRLGVESTPSSLLNIVKSVATPSKGLNPGQNDPRGLVTESIGRKIREAVPTIEVYPATGIITLPEAMLFEINSAVLSPVGISAVNKLALQLEKILPCYVARPSIPCSENPQKSEIDTIFVEGHTDSRPLISESYDNTNLSFDRARSVYRLLAQRKDNINLLQFKNQNEQQLFSMSGYADTRPVPGENGLADKNRRVDLRIVLAYKKGNTENSVNDTTSKLQNSTR